VDPVGQLGHLLGQALGPGDLAAAVEDGHDTHDEQGDETEEQVSQQKCGHPDHVTGLSVAKRHDPGTWECRV
jgi:hypothetical protein